MKTPIYVSNVGGAIYSFKGDTGWLFRVTTNKISLYCNDLTTAKVQLKRIESLKCSSMKLSLAASIRTGRSLKELVENAAKPYLFKTRQ